MAIRRPAQVGVVIAAIVAVSAMPAASAGFFQAGVNAARDGMSSSRGAEWGDLAFSVGVPGLVNTFSPPLIIDGRVYVAVHPPKGQEKTGFNGVMMVDSRTGLSEPFATIPPWPVVPGLPDEVPPQVREPLSDKIVYKTSLVSDGSLLFVTHNLGVDAFRLTDGARQWHWVPDGGPWGEYDHLVCPTPGLRDGVLYVACEWHVVPPGGGNGADNEHRLVANALDARTGEPVWPSQWRGSRQDVIPAGNPVSNATSRKFWMVSLGVVEDLVLVSMQDYTDVWGSYQGALQALDTRTGVPRWIVNQTFANVGDHWSESFWWTVENRKFRRTAWYDAAPPTGQDSLVFYDYHLLYAIWAANGSIAHQQYLPMDGRGPDIGAGMALGRGSLYAASGDAIFEVSTRTFQRTEFVRLPENQAWAKGGFVIDDGVFYALVNTLRASIQDAFPDFEVVSTSLQAIDLVTRRVLWAHDVPMEGAGGQQSQSFAVGDGLVVVAGRSGNVSILGRTPLSVGVEWEASNLYPALLEEVTLNLSKSTPGVHGPPTQYRVDWGDDVMTNWQGEPNFTHRFSDAKVTTARAFARNALQNSSSPIVFQVGGSPPSLPGPPAVLVVPGESPELSAVQRFFAPQNAPVWATSAALALALLILPMLLLAKGSRRELPAEKTRYRVIQELGHGAYGRTFLARDTLLGRKVVLKQPTAPWLLEDTSRKKFLKEARILARLTHANVVTVFEILPRSKPPTLVLEYLERGSLETLLKRSRSLSIDLAYNLAADVLRGLKHIHEAGIVHRDIKPANILIDREGVAKVSDLGIARPPDDMATATMAAGSQPGSLLYMSPEQVIGRTVDHRSDLFSAAAVFYEMFSGEHYMGNGRQPEFQVRQRIVAGDFDINSAHLPEPMRRVLRKALQRNPASRYPSAGAMLTALKEAAMANGNGRLMRQKALTRSPAVSVAPS